MCIYKNKTSNLAPDYGNSVSCCQFESSSESSSLSNSDTDLLFESLSVLSASTVEIEEPFGKEIDSGVTSFKRYCKQNRENSDRSISEARFYIENRQLSLSTFLYDHHLPDPGSGKALIFDSKSAEDFIERFEGIYKCRRIYKWEDFCQYFSEYLDRPLKQ